MFFYRIERLKNINTMNKTISNALKGDHFTIIPLVNPNCAFGKFLMDQKQSAVLSEYSEPHVNIFYTDEDLKSEYPWFVDHILSEARNISGKEVKEPCLLIFFPKREQMVTLEVTGEDNQMNFRSLMFEVIDTLELKNSIDNISNLKEKLKLTNANQKNSHLINGLYADVIKFFA